MFTLYFSIEIVGLKCSVEEKKLKIITCFTRIKRNQKIALSIFLTNRLTSCVIEGIGFQRRAKEKPFIPWQGQLGEKEGNFPFMPVKGLSSEQAQFLWSVWSMWKCHGWCPEPSSLLQSTVNLNGWSLGTMLYKRMIKTRAESMFYLGRKTLGLPGKAILFLCFLYFKKISR